MDMPMQMLQQGLLFPEPMRDWARKQRRESRGGAEARRDNRGHHENSLAAHGSLEGALERRKAEIVAWVDIHGPCSIRRILEGLFGAGADMDLVRPRVSELIDDTKLAECGKVADHVTGRPVMLVDLAGRVPRQDAKDAKKEVES
jgi:hypothetical protein